MPEEFKNKTRSVVKPYSHKVGHNFIRSAKKFGIPLVLSAPNKEGRLCVEINKYSK